CVWSVWRGMLLNDDILIRVAGHLDPYSAPDRHALLACLTSSRSLFAVTAPLLWTAHAAINPAEGLGFPKLGDNKWAERKYHPIAKDTYLSAVRHLELGLVSSGRGSCVEVKTVGHWLRRLHTLKLQPLADLEDLHTGSILEPIEASQECRDCHARWRVWLQDNQRQQVGPYAAVVPTVVEASHEEVDAVAQLVQSSRIKRLSVVREGEFDMVFGEPHRNEDYLPRLLPLLGSTLEHLSLGNEDNYFSFSYSDAEAIVAHLDTVNPVLTLGLHLLYNDLEPLAPLLTADIPPRVVSYKTLHVSSPEATRDVAQILSAFRTTLTDVTVNVNLVPNIPADLYASLAGLRSLTSLAISLPPTVDAALLNTTLSALVALRHLHVNYVGADLLSIDDALPSLVAVESLHVSGAQKTGGKVAVSFPTPRPIASMVVKRGRLIVAADSTARARALAALQSVTMRDAEVVDEEGNDAKEDWRMWMCDARVTPRLGSLEIRGQNRLLKVGNWFGEGGMRTLIEEERESSDELLDTLGGTMD
ncbi:hypothetical protein HK101_008532, partial [Irineochytrium annulatum]